MRRINGKKHIIVDGKKQFAEGTSVTPDWFNDVQEELCSIIESEEIPLAEPRNQLKEAVDKKLKRVVDEIWKAIEQSRAPIGSLIQTFLTEKQLLDQGYVGWTLCDGKKVEGSQYQKLGLGDEVPDCSGRFFRTFDHIGILDVGSTHKPKTIGDSDVFIVPYQAAAAPGKQESQYLIVINTFIRID